MDRLPLLSGREIVLKLKRFGYEVIRQRGSHLRLSSRGRCSVTVPDYKIVDRTLLKSILFAAKITAGDFLEIVNKKRRCPKS